MEQFLHCREQHPVVPRSVVEMLLAPLVRFAAWARAGDLPRIASLKLAAAHLTHADYLWTKTSGVMLARPGAATCDAEFPAFWQLRIGDGLAAHDALAGGSDPRESDLMISGPRPFPLSEIIPSIGARLRAGLGRERSQRDLVLLVADDADRDG